MRSWKAIWSPSSPGPRVVAAFAQAGDAPASDPIGEVTKLDGDARVARAGTGEVVELAVGATVFAGDVVETGEDSLVGILFVDETILNINAGSRMVLDELVYNPGGSDSSMLMSLVSGSFAFISGEIAPSGNMELRTPIATLGIRGTSGWAGFDLDLAVAEFLNFVDPTTGEISQISVYDTAGRLLGIITTDNQKAWFDGNEFFQPLMNVDQQRLAEGIRETLIETALSAGIEVTQSITDGERRYALIVDYDFAEPDKTVDLGSRGEAVSSGLTDGEGAAGIVAGDVNQPPIGPFLASLTSEDAGLFSINLLAGWRDPEGHALAVEGVAVTLSDGRAFAFDIVTDGSGTVANLTFDADQFDDLALGEQVTIAVSYRVSDSFFTGPGIAPDGSLTLVVEGRNDTPSVTVLAPEVDVSEQEGATGSAALIGDGGVIDFSDDDLNDIGDTAAVISVMIEGETSGLEAALDLLGAVGATLEEKLLDAGFVAPLLVTKDAGVSEGTIEWAFQAPDFVFDYLAGSGESAESVILTYHFVLDDEEDVSVPSEEKGEVSQTTLELDLKVTITGTNDAPMVSGELVEAGIDSVPDLGSSIIEASGTIAFDDVDRSDSHIVSFEPIGTALGTLSALAITTAATGAGAGEISWTYEVDPDLVAELSIGEELVEEFLVTVSDNRPDALSDTFTVRVTIVGAASEPVINTVADAFSEKSYNLNDGNKLWASSWIEIADASSNGLPAENGSPLEGSVRIENAHGGEGLHLALWGNDEVSGEPHGIERTVDLSAATSATLTFDYQRNVEEGGPGKGVLVRVTAADGTFTEVQLVDVGTNFDEDVLSFSLDISDFISDQTTIAFLVADGLLANDVVVVDNVQVEYVSGADPILLDLDGDGTLFSSDRVEFDFDGDGVRETIGWGEGGDGMLVVDVDGDGLISTGAEIVSPEMVPDAATSLAALASFDSNLDGIIDGGDARFDALLIWRDGNEDGMTDSSELHTLADLGIASIDLGASSSTIRDPSGNIVTASGEFTAVDGSVGTYSQVSFVEDVGADTQSDGYDLLFSGETIDLGPAPEGEGLPGLDAALADLDAGTNTGFAGETGAPAPYDAAGLSATDRLFDNTDPSPSNLGT